MTMEALIALQDAVINWGQLLIASGGGTEACKVCLSSHIVQVDGQWYLVIQHQP